MPLADEPSRVPGRSQSLGERHLFEWQIGRPRRALQTGLFGDVIRIAGRVIGNLQSGRCDASDHGGASGCADRCRRVAVGKSHALSSKAVEMRSVQRRVSLAMQIHPTEIIGHDQDNIRAIVGISANGLWVNELQREGEERNHRERR